MKTPRQERLSWSHILLSNRPGRSHSYLIHATRKEELQAPR